MNEPEHRSELVTIFVPADDLALIARHEANHWLANKLGREVRAALGPDVDHDDIVRAVRATPWLGYAQHHVRGGLIEGRADELASLRSDAELAAMDAAALLRLVDHVEATHPLARRRAQRRAAASG